MTLSRAIVFSVALAVSAPALAQAPAPAPLPQPPHLVPGQPPVPAPTGHRQPTASDVPADDSVVGNSLVQPKRPDAEPPVVNKLDDAHTRKIMRSVCRGC